MLRVRLAVRQSAQARRGMQRKRAAHQRRRRQTGPPGWLPWRP